MQIPIFKTKCINTPRECIEISKKEESSISGSPKTDNLIPNTENSKIILIDKCPTYDCDDISHACITVEHPKNNSALSSINCEKEVKDSDRLQIKNSKTISMNKEGNIKLKHKKLSCCANKQHSNSENSKSKFSKALRTMTILKDPSFLVIMICQSAQSYISVLVYTIVIDFSRDKGILHSHEQFFLMFLPVAQTFGHVGLGRTKDS